MLSLAKAGARFAWWLITTKLPLIDSKHSEEINTEQRRSGLRTAGVVVLTVATVYVVRKVAKSTDPSIQYAKTKVMRVLMTEPVNRPEVVRNAFNDLPLTEFRTSTAHTHPIAAADRSSASSFIDRLGPVLGRTTYFVQRSRADERNGRPGSRAYYWSKDLNAEAAPLVLPANPLVAFVDVDQYVDMPQFLSDNVHPTVLYTFQPDSVAKVTENYSYSFNADNTVDYHVSGGGKFVQEVWNYSTDHLLLRRTILGIPFRAVAYLVDRRQTSPDHELIMFTPQGSWGWLGAWLATSWLTGRQLTRLQPAQPNGYTRLVTSSTKGVMVSTGRPGSYACANIPIAADDTISVIARTSKYDLTMPQVMSFVEGDKIQAAALLDYHRNVSQKQDGKAEKPPVVCPVGDAVRRYQFKPELFDPEAKPSMVAFMTPMIHGAFCPDMTKGNEEQCVQERVLKVQPKTLPITPFIAKCMEEFCNLLIRDDVKHSLDPVDDDEVLDRQNRPQQRRILAVNETVEAKRDGQMFLKKEAYANVKDPRPITQINGHDKREYSKYLYAFEAVLKMQPWYAFGKTPKDIAARVCEVVKDAIKAANSDFSRFDGHGSNLMRELERRVLLRAFRVQYHDELMELHRSQFQLKCYATFGTKYQSKYSRLSGSPETSLFNTLVNAFVAFLCLRMTKQNGIFFDAKEAFARLGVYGGDDGLTADVEPMVYKRAASMIGQDLTVTPVARGQLGIKFLSRVYSPFVWEGDTTSCCDLPRQLSKFHVTVSLPSTVTPVMKLLEKTRCFILTDEHTPIIGDFCKAVLSVHRGPTIEADGKLSQVSTWWSKYDKESQYPNSPADWLQEYTAEALPNFDMKKFTTWVQQATTYEQLLKPPTFEEPVPAKSGAPVVVDQQLILPPPNQPIAPVPARPERKVARNAPGAPSNSGNWRKKEEKKVESKQAIEELTKEEKQRRFEDWKQKKIAAGTWKPDPPPKRNGPTGRPPRSGS